MSATEDVARMLALVPWLLARDAPTVSQAVEAFGISEEQLRADVERLNFCGLPGFRGGDLFECDLIGDRIVLRMADELRRPLRLGAAEAVRLVLLLETATGLLDDVPALRTGLAKVRRAAGVPESVTVEVVQEAAGAARTCRQAIRDGKQVTLEYQGRRDDAPRTRRIDPWAVHVEGGRLYLQGHDLDADDARSFRLDRAAKVAIVDQPLTHAPPAELRAPRYQAGPDDLKVTLRLDPAGAWVADALDPDEVTERKDGGLTAVVRTDAPAHLETLVLHAAGAARISRPKAVREGLLERVDQALAAYEDLGPASTD